MLQGLMVERNIDKIIFSHRKERNSSKVCKIRKEF